MDFSAGRFRRTCPHVLTIAQITFSVHYRFMSNALSSHVAAGALSVHLGTFRDNMKEHP